jgi:CrcB protein
MRSYVSLTRIKYPFCTGSDLIQTFLLVALGGAIGSTLRFLASLLIKGSSVSFPVSTLGVNIIGCFAIGMLGRVFVAEGSGHFLRLFLITGLLGGFTTFSAFSYETVEMIRNGKSYFAIVYICSSVIGGVVAVVLGMRLSDFWR